MLPNQPPAGGRNAVELSAKSPSPLGRGVGVRGVESVAMPHFDRPHPNPPPLGEGTNLLNSTALAGGWLLLWGFSPDAVMGQSPYFSL